MLFDDSSAYLNTYSGITEEDNLYTVTMLNSNRGKLLILNANTFLINKWSDSFVPLSARIVHMAKRGRLLFLVHLDIWWNIVIYDIESDSYTIANDGNKEYLNGDHKVAKVIEQNDKLLLIPNDLSNNLILYDMSKRDFEESAVLEDALAQMGLSDEKRTEQRPNIDYINAQHPEDIVSIGNTVFALFPQDGYLDMYENGIYTRRFCFPEDGRHIISEQRSYYFAHIPYEEKIICLPFSYTHYLVLSDIAPYVRFYDAGIEESFLIRQYKQDGLLPQIAKENDQLSLKDYLKIVNV